MDKRKVFVLGDSISIHYGPYLEQMAKGVFVYDRKSGKDSEENKNEIEQGVGANGGDSSQVLEYLTMEQEKGVTYDILLLNCGLHDIRIDKNTKRYQVDIDEYEINLNHIIEKAVKMSKTVIWVATTQVIDEIHNGRTDMFLRYEKDLLEYNRIADKVMKEHIIPVIDLYTYTKQYGGEAFLDHVHYKDETRRLQAGYIAGFLNCMMQFEKAGGGL